MARTSGLLAGIRAGSSRRSSTPTPVSGPTFSDVLRNMGAQTVPQESSPAADAADVSRVSRSSAPQSFKDVIRRVSEGQQESGHGGGFWNALGGVPIVGRVEHTIGDLLASTPVQKTLNIIDLPRAAVVSGVQEGFEKLGMAPNNNESWLDQLKRHESYREVLNNTGGDHLPGWVKAIAGFAGDVAFDPTSYVGAGLVKDAGIGVLEGMGRKEVAQLVAEKTAQAGSQGLLSSAEQTAAEKLIARAGTHGKAALTERGLKKIGADTSLTEKLGITPQFGVHVGALGHNKTIGGRAVAEAAENMKGELKAQLAKTRLAAGVRTIRVPDVDRALVDKLFSGQGTVHERANAARVLGATHIARGESARYVDEMSRWIKQELHPLLKKGEDINWSDALDQVERGTPVSEAAQKLDAFFKAAADQAEAAGIPFDRRAGYVPHRFTEEARNFLSDPQAVKQAGLEKLAKKGETFERPRQLSVGDTFLGEKLKSANISEINDISQRKLGLDWFETNPDKLIGRYMSEAGRSIESQATGRALKLLGAPVEDMQRIVKDIPNVDPATARRLADLTSLESMARRKEAASYRMAARKSNSAVKAATRALESQGKRLTDRLSVAEVAINDGRDQLTKIASQRADAEMAHEVASRALEHARLAAERAVPAARHQAELRFDQLQGVVKDRAVKAEALRAKMEQATVDLAHAEDVYGQAIAKHVRDAREEAVAAGREVKQRNLQAVARRRAGEEAAAMHQAADVTNVTKAELARVEGEGAAAAKEIPGAMKAMNETTVENAVTPERTTVAEARAHLDRLDEAQRSVETDIATNEQLVPQLQARATAIEDAVRGNADASKAFEKNRKFKGPKTLAEKSYAMDLSRRARLVSDVLATEGMDPQVAKVANLEAKALAHQMDAVEFGDTAAMRRDTMDGLRDGRVRRQISYNLQKGWSDLGGHMATSDPDLARQVATVKSIFDSPKATNALLKGYDAWNSWFKTWAVTSPGFIVRNMQGGWLNNLIAGVRMSDYKEFGAHYRMYANNPTNWFEKITAKYGRDSAERFSGALDAIAATGFGQSAQEAGIGQFYHGKLRRGFDKTLGTQNPASVFIRSRNEDAEALLRGANAYATFRMLGRDSGELPIASAIDQVSKYHFNYRDLSSFDRAAKRVIPFWVFTSRNLPLQLENLVKHPDVINRTFGNLQRTLSTGVPGDQNEPFYMKQGMAIPLGDVPGFGEKGSTDYLSLDLPFIRVQDDVQKFTDIEKLLSDANPLLRVPLELNAGKQFFDNVPLDAQNTQNPSLLEGLPGIKQVLEATGALKNGQITETGDYAFNSLLPLASRVGRLSPTTQGDSQAKRDRSAQVGDIKQKEAIVSQLLGMGIRTNTPERQKGEQLRREIEVKSLLDEAKRRGYLKGG